MSDQAAFTCLCGRRFAQENSYSKHQRSCQKTKKRLAGALGKARDLWTAKKQKRSHDISMESTAAAVAGPSDSTDDMQPCGSDPGRDSGQPEDLTTPLDESRPRRFNRRLPERFRDVIPHPPPRLPPPDCPTITPDSPLDSDSNPNPDPNNAAPSDTDSRPRSFGIRQIFRTPRNVFGLVRRYFTNQLPSVDPEEHVTLQDLSSTPQAELSADSVANPVAAFYPFPNESSFRLGHWYWNGGVQKSQQSFKDLLDIVGDPAFNPDDIHKTKWDEINTVLADPVKDDTEGEWMDEDAGWTKTKIKISVPFHRRMKTRGPRDFIGADLYHRSLVAVIRERIADRHTAKHFHMEPYELLWKPTDHHEEIKIHGEIYTSEAFLQAHQALQDSPSEPDCDLQRVVVALMFYSDSTHLTSFGTSQLWPCYLFIGNESKYRRCKPSCHSCSHVAYFQKLPDEFKDFADKHTGGKGPKKSLFTHCRREFFHEQVKVLLDDEFLDAYRHGIVITCFDGIKRRFYPRIFTYSADYPEKVILACIRNRGACPCPRCLIPMDRMQNLGMTRDRQQRSTLRRVDNDKRRFNVANARRLIYGKNYAVDSKTLDPILKSESLVPTTNSFSDRLQPLGFDFFSMLVVDLMHEFELGVWKSLFIHLLRILASVNPNLLHELDRRFRQIPTFGRDTIRKFSANMSEMKKLAARDFEDMLQCAIPVFDGLLPEPQNSAILHLLFTCTHWHGLAKLRMHSDPSLDLMDDVTTTLGEAFRDFQREICPMYGTQELPREANARRRRSQRQNTNSTAKEKPSDTEPLKKEFNLQTYKYHALGDYVETIRHMGTTDSYNTTVGELEHRTSKARYLRTDRKAFVKQLTRMERRQTRLRRIKQKLSTSTRVEDVATTPDAHHHIGLSENRYEHIGTFLRTNSGDPAIKGFLPMLKAHLLPRIKALLARDEDISVEDMHVDGAIPLASPNISEVDHVLFKHDHLYRHNIMRINYTTYDVHRKQDTINPSTPHRDIMVLAQEEDNSANHPFLYARVIGIFHANVVYTGHQIIDYRPRRLEFLWVRWFEQDDSAGPRGWVSSTLDRLRFPPMANEGAFGFLDPADVVRGTHIMPAFASGKRYEGVVKGRVAPAFTSGNRIVEGKGISPCAKDTGDWRSYYVGRFVDRDMVMRYHWGLAIGHVYTHRQRSTHAGVSWPGIDVYSKRRTATPPVDPQIEPRLEKEQREGNGESMVDIDGNGGENGGDGDGSEDDDKVQDDIGTDDEWEDEDGWTESDGDDDSEWSNERDLLDLDEMYGYAEVDSEYED